MRNRGSRLIRGRGARTLLPILLFGLLFVVETGAFERATAAEPVVALPPGFTVIVWEQPDQEVAGAVSHLNAREDRVSQVEAVFGWIDADQSWRMYRPHGPDFLNTLETLQTGHMYWILAIPVTEAVEVVEPEAELAPGAAPLSATFPTQMGAIDPFHCRGPLPPFLFGIASVHSVPGEADNKRCPGRPLKSLPRQTCSCQYTNAPLVARQRR